MTTMTTYLRRTGFRVLAKRYKGELVPMTFANRTQAERRADEWGGVVCQPNLSRPFYVRFCGNCPVDAGLHAPGKCPNARDGEGPTPEQTPSVNDHPTFPFPCPSCGEEITGKDLDGHPCDDCRTRAACHLCSWPDSDVIERPDDHGKPIAGVFK